MVKKLNIHPYELAAIRLWFAGEEDKLKFYQGREIDDTSPLSKEGVLDRRIKYLEKAKAELNDILKSDPSTSATRAARFLEQIRFLGYKSELLLGSNQGEKLPHQLSKTYLSTFDTDPLSNALRDEYGLFLKSTIPYTHFPETDANALSLAVYMMTQLDEDQLSPGLTTAFRQALQALAISEIVKNEGNKEGNKLAYRLRAAYDNQAGLVSGDNAVLHDFLVPMEVAKLYGKTDGVSFEDLVSDKPVLNRLLARTETAIGRNVRTQTLARVRFSRARVATLGI